MTDLSDGIHSVPVISDPVDQIDRLLGWIGIGLGALELLAPKVVTGTLGVRGKEDLVRAYGVHEMGTGLLLVSGTKPAGIWSRLVGDGLNFALLLSAFRRDNPKRLIAGVSLAVLVGLTIHDLVGAQRTAGQPGDAGEDTASRA